MDKEHWHKINAFVLAELDQKLLKQMKRKYITSEGQAKW